MKKKEKNHRRVRYDTGTDDTKRGKGYGKGVNLGYFGKEENKVIAEKLRIAFTEWIDNGHNNFADENTVILCVRLTDGVLFSHGTRYDIDFTEN